MAFKITGISAEPFVDLYGLADAELRKRGAIRCRVDESPGYPDRIEMREAEIGETMLLVNHVCQPADTPYRASHAIYVREGARTPYVGIDEVPIVMRRRLLSLRGFDEAGMMRDADVVEGTAIEGTIARMFANPDIAYIHVHNAKRGCYSGRIDRHD